MGGGGEENTMIGAIGGIEAIGTIGGGEGVGATRRGRQDPRTATPPGVHVAGPRWGTAGRANHPPGRDERKKGGPFSVLLPSTFCIPSFGFFLRLLAL